jgi:hypothetical protein
MKKTIDTDYLIIGAGGMGMAFADEILTQTSATITIVDRNHRPGGHWLDAYPFVRLHQASVCYGVNSVPLGEHAIDHVGWNKGCYELACGRRIESYYGEVMRSHFLPTGRVTYLPMHDYIGGGLVRSRLNDNECHVRAKKIVDSTYMNVTVPSQRPPKFNVEAGSVCIPPNDLPKLAPDYRSYVIIGSGKTGMDTCLFLLEHGVDPDAITWVMPNDAYYFDRFTVNPGRKFTDIITTGRTDVLNASLTASSMDDFFKRLLDCGQLIQLDDKVKPTRWRCATVTQLELEQLRSIKNVVRMGHVLSVGAGGIEMADGLAQVKSGSLFVDCAADGLEKRPEKKVFDGNLITLQTVRMCQQVYSAGFIGNVAANFEDQDHMNTLCRPVPHPYLVEDYLRCVVEDSENMLEWLTEPSVVSWINASRIDLFSPIFDFDDPEVRCHIEAMGDLIKAAIPKLNQLLLA